MEKARWKQQKILMGIVKLYIVILWMCDVKLDLADILLRAYYTYIEVQIKVAKTGTTLVKLNVSCNLCSSSVKCPH